MKLNKIEIAEQLASRGVKEGAYIQNYNNYGDATGAGTITKMNESSVYYNGRRESLNTIAQRIKKGQCKVIVK